MKLNQKQISNLYIPTVIAAQQTNFTENDIVYIEDVKMSYISKTSTANEDIPNIIIGNNGFRLFKMYDSITPIVDVFEVVNTIGQTITVTTPTLIEFDTILINNTNFTNTNGVITINDDYNRLEVSYKVIYYSDNKNPIRSDIGQYLGYLRLNSTNFFNTLDIDSSNNTNEYGCISYQHTFLNVQSGDIIELFMEQFTGPSRYIIASNVTNMLIKGYK